MATRIKEFDANLEKSEQLIKTATLALAETVELEMERKRIKKENNEDDSDCDESDPLRQFDAQMALLEGKLVQAKQLASQDHIISLQSVLENKHKDQLMSDSLENKEAQISDVKYFCSQLARTMSLRSEKRRKKKKGREREQSN